MFDNAFWEMVLLAFYEPVSYAAAVIIIIQFFFWLLQGVYTLFNIKAKQG